MAFVPCPRTARAEIRGTLEGRVVENVLHFLFPSDYSLIDIEALASALDSCLPFILTTVMPAAYQYRETYVRGLSSAEDFQATNTDSAGAGSGGGTLLPNATAFVVTLLTGLTGRSQRGRVYIPGMTREDEDSPNIIATTRATKFHDWVELLRTTAADIGWDMAVLSLQTGGVPRLEGVASIVKNVVINRLEFSTQRRRMKGASA